MQNFVRILILCTLSTAVATLTTSCKKRPHTQTGVIRIDGIDEPAELLIPAEISVAKTPEIVALGTALEGISGGNETRGLPGLDAFILKYPNVGDAYPLRATLRCMNNDLVGAYADVEKALTTPLRIIAKSSNEDRPELLALHAKLAFLRGDKATVARDVSSIIALYSSDLQYLTDGRVKMQDKPNSPCYWTPETIQRWVRDDNQSPDAAVFETMYISAFAPLDDDAKVLAKAHAASLVQNQPQSAGAYFYAAVATQKIVAYKSLAFNEAERSSFDRGMSDLYTKAIELNPKIEDAYAQRADEHLQEKEYTPAIADYDHAIDLAPQDAGLWNDRGLAKEETYDKDGAIADFSKAIELKTTKADFNALTMSLDNRAALFVKLGDFRKALTDYNNLIGYRLHDVMFSINLDFFRQLYPEYASVDDARLKDKLRKMYYPNFSEPTFDEIITKPTGAHPSMSAFLPEAYLQRADVLLALKDFAPAKADLARAMRFNEQRTDNRWRTPPGLQGVRIDLQTLEIEDHSIIKVWTRLGTEDSAPADDAPTRFAIDCQHRTVQTLPAGPSTDPPPGSLEEQLRDCFCTAK